MASIKWSELPVLDFSRLEAGPAEKAKFLAELREVAYELGFFYLSGHGIDPNLTDQILAVSRQFFDLPEAEKIAIEMVNSPHFRGYTRIGLEQTRGLPDWREQIDIGAEKPALPTDTGLPAYWRLQGPNLWPVNLPELKEVTLRYQATLSDLAIRLLHAFAAALGQPKLSLTHISTLTPTS